MENKGFEIISGGEKDDSLEQKVAEIETLTRQYACSIAERPMWCVWGSDGRGGHGVLYWVKPVEEDEFIAHKIAKLVTEVGGHAKAKMTEWNSELKGDPIYKNAKNILKT